MKTFGIGLIYHDLGEGCIEGTIEGLLQGKSNTKYVTKLSSTSHFSNDLGLDSLDTVEVVMAIEEV